MELNGQDREQLELYLLGQMVEAGLSQVEERLMSDSNLYEELLILEDEIIDRYVRGKMPEPDRASFEGYFLQSSEHQAKVRFARALSRYVDGTPSEVTNIEPEAVAPAPTLATDKGSGVCDPVEPRRLSFWPFQSPVLSYALAFVLIIAIGGVAWIAVESLKSAGPGKVFEAILVPGGMTREGGGAIQAISIPSGTDTVRVRLILPPDQYENYGVELLASDGTSPWTQEDLKSFEVSGQKSLQIDVPAKLLKRDIYKLKLSGRRSGRYDEIASYNFRISTN